MLILSTLVISQYCSPGKEVCYSLKKDNNNLVVDIVSKVQGYAAFGVGVTMVGDIVVAWPDNGKVIVSNRVSKSAVLPTYKENSNLKIVQSATTSDGFTLTLSRPLAASDGFTTAATTKYMAAYYRNAVGSSDPQYAFTIHNWEKNFNYDLETGLSSADAINYSSVHGIVMVIAWMFIVPLAVLVSRYGKGKLGAKWYPIHKALNMIAFILTTIGLILICVGKDNQVFTEGNIAHPLIGSIVYGVMIIQMGLGMYINKKWNANRTKIPWHDKLHWIVGYSLLVLGLINTILAIFIGEGPLPFIGIGVFILFLITFGALQLTMGQVHHQVELIN